MNHTIMASLRRGRGRVVVVLTSGALVASMLAAGLALAPAAAASFPPGEGGAGGTLTASFSQPTVCNINTSSLGSSTQPLVLTVGVSTLAGNKKALKTLFVAVPAGYTVSSASAAGATVTVLTTSSPNYVRVGGLSVGKAGSVTVTINAILPWGAPSTPATWAIEGETGNDLKPDLDKPDGDDYTVPATTTPATTTVAEQCTLAFAYGPADAGAGLNITNAALEPTLSATAPVVNPVTVDVTDTNAVAVTTSVTLGLSVPTGVVLPAGAALTGGGSTPASTAAAASFGTGSLTGPLSVNIQGIYTLTASSPTLGIQSAVSSTFVVWGAAQACASSPCTLPPLTGSTPPSGSPETFNVSANSSGAIGASLDLVSIDCSAADFGGVAAIPGTDTITWTSSGLTDGAKKTTTIFIPDTTLANAANPLLAEIHYMVCASVQGYDFPVAYTPGGPMKATEDQAVEAALPGTGMWYRGLLPDCQDVTSGPPCVASRVHGSVGSVTGVTVTVLTGVGAGDPFGR